jgi:hypothetical protein
LDNADHAANDRRSGSPSPTDAELLRRVRQAWADVLDLDDADAVPLDANFLEVGGSSLLLIMLWEELLEVAGNGLKVSDLFQQSTVRAQAGFIAGGRAEDSVPEFGAKDRHQLLGLARRGQHAGQLVAGQ